MQTSSWNHAPCVMMEEHKNLMCLGLERSYGCYRVSRSSEGEIKTTIITAIKPAQLQSLIHPSSSPA